MKSPIKSFMVSCILLFFLITGAVAQNLSEDKKTIAHLIEQNELSWSIDDRIVVRNDRVVELDLSNKNFGEDGLFTLPETIGKLDSLAVLKLNANDLSKLPESLTFISGLKRLEVTDNTLRSLPEGIGNLTNLVELDVRNNMIKVLPRSMTILNNLTKLQLWGNRLENLPENFGDLANLKELYLKNNRLSDFPKSITSLKLNYIDITNNQLCGLDDTVAKWLKKYDPEYLKIQNCDGAIVRLK